MANYVYQVKAFPTDDGNLYVDFDNAANYMASVADTFGVTNYPSRREILAELMKDKVVMIQCGYANRNRITMILKEVL